MPDYANRTDLQNPAQKIAAKAATGQTYGEAGKQIAAQQAVPMGPSPTAAFAKPGSVVDLHAPTELPSQPLNNNYVPPVPQPQYKFGDPVLEELRQLYSMYPTDDLASLISAYDRYFR